MAEIRLCGHYGCRFYSHNYFSDPVLPNGTCKYSEKEITVHPGDDCRFGLLSTSEELERAKESKLAKEVDSLKPRGTNPGKPY